MTFTDKWHSVYPENSREFVRFGKYIDINLELKELSEKITSRAKTSDEAILYIHQFIKNLENDNVPIFPKENVKPATRILKELSKNPSMKFLSYNKSILETALLRAIDIPAKIATYTCKYSSLPQIFNKSYKKLLSQVPIIKGLHNAVDVFSIRGNGFKKVDSWIPERKCAEFKDACFKDDVKEWYDNNEIQGMQKQFECKKLISQEDYPGLLANAINAIAFMRKRSNILDIIDPIED